MLPALSNAYLIFSAPKAAEILLRRGSAQKIAA
jgi:hypothetical protein